MAKSSHIDDDNHYKKQKKNKHYRLCSQCGKRKALYEVRYRDKMRLTRTDKDHDLCRQCYIALIQKEHSEQSSST